MRVELAVVGGGPAGIHAALAACRVGVEVALIDAASRPGGQYYRTPPAALGGGAPQHGADVLEVLRDSPVNLLCGVTVWGAFEEGGGFSLSALASEGPLRIDASKLIVAPGAYDRPVPFPGWTLPGVMTAGGVQAFVHGQGVLPGRRFLVAGSGPLQLAVAAGIVEAGGDVAAVLESAANPLRAAPQLPGLWGQGERLREGRGYLATLARARVPFRLGWGIFAACGATHVEEVVVGRLDRRGARVAGSGQAVRVDTVVSGYGLLPRTELTRLLGCAHEWDGSRGGYVPCRDPDFRTSLPGLYAVGDGAGIGGAALAEIEGRIAGATVAHSLGKLSTRDHQATVDAEAAGLRREQRFARMLCTVFAPRPGLYGLATGDTLLCRCEEVTVSQVRQALREGATSMNEIKGLTRAGMGNCQGRMCEEAIARFIAAETGGSALDPAALERAGHFTVRPPLHPLPLGVLAAAAALQDG